MKNRAQKAFPMGLRVFLVGLILISSACFKQIPPEKLKKSIELIDIETRWEKKYYQPWPPKLILVPAISFRIKNIGDEPLKYIYCNAIFRFKDDIENLGDNFVAGIGGDAVLPGQTSNVITMQSYYGVEGKNIAHFKSNPAWKVAEARVFIKSKGSQYVLIGEYDVSRTINFSEPEPVGMTPTKKDEEKK